MDLFDKENRYTDEASDLNEKTYNAITAIFEEFVTKGCSPRDISYIMNRAIEEKELETLL